IRDRTVTGVQTCALPIYELEIRFFAAAIAESDLVPRTFEKIAWALPKELGEYDFLAANSGLIAQLATGRIKPADILDSAEETGEIGRASWRERVKEEVVG